MNGLKLLKAQANLCFTMIKDKRLLVGITNYISALEERVTALEKQLADAADMLQEERE